MLFMNWCTIVVLSIFVWLLSWICCCLYASFSCDGIIHWAYAVFSATIDINNTPKPMTIAMATGINIIRIKTNDLPTLPINEISSEDIRRIVIGY